jgi:hypothetical protein
MNIFTYWHNSDHNLNAFLNDWLNNQLSPSILNDFIVKDIINKKFPKYLKLYENITIPACKSDVARLIILFQYGGIYLDAHSGSNSMSELLKIYQKLDYFSTIVFTTKKNDKDQLFNGALIARPESKIILKFIEQCFDNLLVHYRKECSTDNYVPYNLAALTGAWVLRTQIFSLSSANFILNTDLTGEVFVVDLSTYPQGDLPFLFYKHYKYREPGNHWSERQTLQKLYACFN